MSFSSYNRKVNSGESRGMGRLILFGGWGANELADNSVWALDPERLPLQRSSSDEVDGYDPEIHTGAWPDRPGRERGRG